MCDIIRRDDIVGARVTDVHMTFEADEWGNYSNAYFTLDSGIIFALPCPTVCEWTATCLPTEAKKLRDEEIVQLPKMNDIVKKIKGSPIRGVFCHKLDGPDDLYGLDSAFLLFEDGGIASLMSSAPNGISSGLFYQSAEEVKEMSGLIDVFDAMLTEEWRNPCGD